MSSKKQYTFSIDSDIRREFKIQTAINETEMSETIESFMENYNKVSVKLKLDIENKNKLNER